MSSEYERLCEDYPATVSMEDLYKICHISKRKASWLLKNGYIPCADTGKKTRRFTIKTSDIVQYLKDREEHPEKYMTPPGIFTSGAKFKDEEVPLAISDENLSEYRKFVENEMKSVADVMTVEQASEIMMNHNLSERIKKKELKTYQYKARQIVTKQDLLDSYFRMVKANRQCYQKFHCFMVKKFFESCEQEQVRLVEEPEDGESFGMQLRM